MEEFGLEGYGYYWACLELVGTQGDEKFSIPQDKSWKTYLKKITGLSVDKQDAYLDYFANLNLIDKKSLTKGILSIPKLKERSDDYTNRVRRMSEHSSDKVPLEENRIEENIPFNGKEYVEKMIQNNRKDVHVVGLYWKFKGFDFPNYKAISGQIGRALKSSKPLLGFSDEQIIATMEYLDNLPDRNYVWTLETVGKRILNVVNNRS